MHFIEIKGARVNNLKNINVKIPLNKITVITGLSGSGKSSLAIDTLYAEGQRRYIESLSSYVRQFLPKIPKPDVDFITNLPPAVAIEAKNVISNPRSTVGTVTEIAEYLRLIFSKIGRVYSSKTGQEIKQYNVSDVLDFILSLEDKTEGFIGFETTVLDKQILKSLNLEGFNRVFFNNNIYKISDLNNIDGHKIIVITQRFIVDKNEKDYKSLSESIELSFKLGNKICIIGYLSNSKWNFKVFKNFFDTVEFPYKELNIQLFNYNSPLGACNTCEGFGHVLGIDEDLVIPDKTKSVYDNAVACWKGEFLTEWKEQLIENAHKINFPIHKPYYQLTSEQKNILWNGCEYFYGINDFFEFVKKNAYKIQYRVLLSRYRDKIICPDCKGTRLKKEIEQIKVGGKSYGDIVNMQVKDIKIFFDTINLTQFERKIIENPVKEINKRIDFLINVGLDYLTLNRSTSTLSGGELQRVHLAAILGNNLSGSLYVLDEPTIGLHPKDTENLIKALFYLRDLGNTVVVVEHDEQIIKNADYIIDLGPGAGKYGGEVVFAGMPTDLKNYVNTSLTAKYLYTTENFKVSHKKNLSKKKITLHNAYLHNLKNITVSFPLNNFIAVTGVSGSGKSTLVKDILYNAIRKTLGENIKVTGYDFLDGDLNSVSKVILIDRNSITPSSRSNALTFLKIYDYLRDIFSEQSLSKINNYKPHYFSYNMKGGRCEECKGEGVIKIEMQFMADIYLTCEACNGKRFKKEILQVEYNGKNIYDIFEMEVSEAINFFSNKESPLERKIADKLKILEHVGLGYLKLGQPTNKMSIGELQRLLLAFYLCEKKINGTIFIFDEPSRGLHFKDVELLIKTFYKLIDEGATLIVIEHNLDIIKKADYIIDLGPQGGIEGGYLNYCGPLIEFLKDANSKSYTLYYLKEKLKHENNLY
ncbi:MAG: excinuclease ABC subunit UvrA [Bacteroidales bacterium]|nr:excinuclease ABC subunit UvrA [Bacteroidales bacterium]